MAFVAAFNLRSISVVQYVVTMKGHAPHPPNNKEENVSIPYINTWLAQSGVQRDTSVFYLVANVVVVSSRVLILANTIPMF